MRSSKIQILSFAALLLSCNQEQDLFADISIISPPGCLGQRISEYVVSYYLGNIAGNRLGDDNQDIIHQADVDSSKCVHVDAATQNLICYRRLRPSPNLYRNDLMIAVQVDALDQDTHAVVLRGQGQTPVIPDNRQSHRITAQLEPVESARGDLLRIRTLASGTSATLRGIWADEEGSAWAVGDAGTMVRWDHLQQRLLATQPGADLRTVWGASTDDAWAAGAMGTVQRLQSRSWSAQAALGSQTLNSIAGNQTADVWAVGDAATIFHFDGQKWADDQSLQNMGSLKLEEHIQAISVDAAGNALAVGVPLGFALIYTAATRAWSRPIANLQPNLYDAWLRAASNGWAVGEGFSGASGAYALSGSWSKNLCSKPSKPLRAVWGNATGRAWAAGDDGNLYLLKTTECEPITTNLFEPLYDIWGTETDLWAVGANGTVIYACIKP